MNPVVDFRGFADQRGLPTLALVDLQSEYILNRRDDEAETVARALTNCRRVLAQARILRFPIAFIRRLEDTSGPADKRPPWIKGFEPYRSDMVFDRVKPSCYSSAEFADMMRYVGGNCIFAGFFGEATCFWTAIDAFKANRRFTYLPDASASRALPGVKADDIHPLITRAVSLFGKVMDTDRWIESVKQTVYL